jgi:hypothetical protein
MRSRVRFASLPWGFFLEEEDSHGDHGLGGLVELRFKALLVPHIHVSPSTSSGQRKSEVGYTSAITGREDHEVHKGHVVALEKKLTVTHPPGSTDECTVLGSSAARYYTASKCCPLTKQNI